jgi:hypothetical protein
VINAYGTYTHSFGDHNLKVTAGYNQELKKYRYIAGSTINLLSVDLNSLDLGTSAPTTNGNQVEWSLLGAFGRINYDYKSKYLLELDGRYDGSSHFPPGQRFGFFPSISGGWRISEENFFDPLKDIFSDVKIRGSWGSLGNQSLSTNLRASDYPYIPVIGTGTSNWLIGGNKPQILAGPVPVSPNLTWEKVASTDIGADIGLLRNRLNIVVDWYNRTTKDMLIPGPTLPVVFGAATPQQNAGDLDTKGFDLGIGWQSSARVNGKSLNYQGAYHAFQQPNKAAQQLLSGPAHRRYLGICGGRLFQERRRGAALSGQPESGQLQYWRLSRRWPPAACGRYEVRGSRWQ